MIATKDLSLWHAVQGFELDQAGAALPFSVKLAREEGWSPAFTQRAIEEYKKFIFLCCVSPTGAAPSPVVDQVWHLHLTYTQSYWVEFCRNTLGKDIHHHPSAGGSSEHERHRDWYGETLALYQTIFDGVAPADIWQRPVPAAVKEVTKPLAAAEPAASGSSLLAVTVVSVVVLPFAFMWFQYERLNPFNLKGPQFLVWFPVFGVCLFIAQLLLRRHRYLASASLAKENFPAEITAFQAGQFFYGQHRALQTAIFDLVDRGWLEVASDERFIVHSRIAVDDLSDLNPLSAHLARTPEGETLSYSEILSTWYRSEAFTTPELTTLENQIAQREPIWIRTASFLVLLVGGARIIQGLANQRPVGALVIEAFAFLFIFQVGRAAYNRSRLIGTTARDLYTGQHYDGVLDRFAMQGSSAIDGLATGVILGSIFSPYSPSPRNIDNSGSSCGSSTSSCGSSSDSGSSSCGGGSSCGGCSGGGD